jgi:hypothetical protein
VQLGHDVTDSDADREPAGRELTVSARRGSPPPAAASHATSGYLVKAWNSETRTWVANGLAVAQSVAAAGSASCSPA